MQYSDSTLFDLVRTLVDRYAPKKPSTIDHARSVTINGFEFTVSGYRGNGMVRVQEPLTGIVWALETLYGADILRRWESDGKPAQWLLVLLRDACNIEQEEYRVTPVAGIVMPSGREVTRCV